MVQSIFGIGRGWLASSRSAIRRPSAPKHRLDRDRAIQGRAEPDELNGPERVAAQVEEVIRHADRPDLQQVFPDRRELFPRPRREGARSASSLATLIRDQDCRQASTIDLAGRSSRQGLDDLEIATGSSDAGACRGGSVGSSRRRWPAAVRATMHATSR